MLTILDLHHSVFFKSDYLGQCRLKHGMLSDQLLAALMKHLLDDSFGLLHETVTHDSIDLGLSLAKDLCATRSH